MKTFTIVFFQLINKQVLSNLLKLVQHLMLHEFLQYLLGEACFVHVPANVPYVFISQSIQLLAA